MLRTKLLIQLIVVCTIADGIQAIRPGAEWLLNGSTYQGLTWLDKVQTKPMEKEVSDAITACQQQQTTKKSQIDQAILDAKDTTKTTDERLNALIKVTLP